MNPEYIRWAKVVHGDVEMATMFLNCGNSKLEAAARHWAGIHHYQIKVKIKVNTTWYGASVKWGTEVPVLLKRNPPSDPALRSFPGSTAVFRRRVADDAPLARHRPF